MVMIILHHHLPLFSLYWKKQRINQVIEMYAKYWDKERQLPFKCNALVKLCRENVSINAIMIDKKILVKLLYLGHMLNCLLVVVFDMHIPEAWNVFITRCDVTASILTQCNNPRMKLYCTSQYWSDVTVTLLSPVKIIVVGMYLNLFICKNVCLFRYSFTIRQISIRTPVFWQIRFVPWSTHFLTIFFAFIG